MSFYHQDPGRFFLATCCRSPGANRGEATKGGRTPSFVEVNVLCKLRRLKRAIQSAGGTTITTTVLVLLLLMPLLCVFALGGRSSWIITMFTTTITSMHPRTGTAAWQNWIGAFDHTGFANDSPLLTFRLYFSVPAELSCYTEAVAQALVLLAFRVTVKGQL